MACYSRGVRSIETRTKIKGTHMKDNYTHISLLIDRSGSMAKLSAETIAGVNSFIKGQQELEGEATLSLATFASDYTLVHDFLPLKTVQPLVEAAYKTAGFTALLDGMSKLVDSVGQKLAAMKEEDRPSKVVCVFVTDGEENRSHQFTREQVFDKIKHQTDKYSWSFVFLGCTQEQIGEATDLGILKGNTLQYDFTKAGISSAYATVGSSMNTYRRSKTTGGSFFGNNAEAPSVVPDTDIKVDGTKVS